MGLFTRRKALPPTRHGYQPPPGGVGRRWICPWDECGRGGPDHPADRWPRTCPGCGTAVVTFSLAEPWQHAAKRVELDARLGGSPDWGDPDRARAEDLLWAADEALRNGHADRVPAIATRLADLLDAGRATGRAEGYDQLFHLVRLLGAAGEWGTAAGVLRRWRRSVRHDDLEDNDQRTEARMLAASLIFYLEEAPATVPVDRQGVWELLQEFIPVMESVVTADIDRSWKRLRHTMAGRRDPDEAAARALERLAALDAARPPRGLPAETPLRMEILGRHTAKGSDSTLDASPIWTVCLQPYLSVSPEELAAVVLPVGGWPVYGASRCLRELGTHDEDGPAYGAIWDAGLEFYHGTGVSSAHLSFDDQQRWIRRHGPGSW
ncbi:hypothetical protein NX794_31205 [Streptomyces sp. LP11]|uniref:Uncharacterized protein n=1 Tax=Streptomyces pyxinicus TaxID=2970331 RepID=A0ABT2BAU1_9ACTN|nr:hypothetical protein [Streptomyces sp. LP11]MCS0605637.1 hypothetical protein [Streptomyces sp. LP11]